MSRPVPGSVTASVVVLIYVVLLGVILLQPSAHIASATIADVADALDDIGAPSALTAPRRVEALLNAAMFIPLALVAKLALPRRTWAEVVVAAFCASVAIEGCQGLFLPARTAEAVDVVANTAGALVGALVAAAIELRSRRGDYA